MRYRYKFDEVGKIGKEGRRKRERKREIYTCHGLYDRRYFGRQYEKLL